MSAADLRRPLLRWYRPRRRAFPWRRDRDPYRVLVSEVMLQQTQAARVGPAFERFVARFPDVHALAAAPRAEVVRAWAGLGYNRRAVALSEAARAIVRDHGGSVPGDVATLRALPGIGPYTAAAVVALAFGGRVVALDVNVRRVVGRVALGADEAPDEVLRAGAAAWLGRGDPAAWHQAVMDLGREVCRPRPRCGDCPLRRGCVAAAAGGVAPSRSRRRQPRFEGSNRQLRGHVVQVLRERGQVHQDDLPSAVGARPEDVAAALRSLTADGIVALRRSEASLAG